MLRIDDAGGRHVKAGLVLDDCGPRFADLDEDEIVFIRCDLFPVDADM